MNTQTLPSKTVFPGLPLAEHAVPGRPLRICIASFDFVGPVRNGGVGTAFTSLGEALAAAGHEVTFLYLSGQFCENGKLEDWILHYRKRGIHFVPMPGHPAPRLEAPFHMARAYEAYVWLRNQQFDIIHFSEWRAPGYYTLLAKHQGLAFEKTLMCVHTHGPTLWSRLSNGEYVTQIEDLELDDMERFSVRMADVTVSPSQYLFQWMQQQGWQLPANSYVQQYVQPASARPPEKPPGRTPAQVKELVFFGRLEVRKGLVLFCDALDKLKEAPEARKLKITFLGKVTRVNGRDGSDYLKERAKQWPWKWQILSDRDQPGAMKYLASESVLALMPSLADNLPNTVLECLGARVPFLTSDIGGIPEMIAPEDFARTCFPLRASPFAEKIKQTLRDGTRPVKPALEPGTTHKAWLDWHAGLKPAGGAALSTLSIQLSQPQPLVSICMSHFNRPEYLRQALASIEAQDYPNFEVVLVDDCSTKPEAIAYIDSLEAPFAARGWQLVRNKEELFVGAARNVAARQARGEYLMFMDDDNCAKPGELSTFMRVAQKTGADILTCFLDFFSGKEAPNPNQTANFRFLFLGGAPAASAFCNYLGDTNSLIRRSVFLQLGGFHEERGVGNEDWELFGDAILKGYHVEVVPEAMVWYRRNDAELSATRTNSLHAGRMRNIRPYLDAVPPALRNLVLFAQGQIMRLTEAGAITDSGPNLQHTIRWRSLFEAGRVLAGLKQEAAAVQTYLDALKAAEASQHPIPILEALIEIGAALTRLDRGRACQLLQMAVELAGKSHCIPAQEKAKQLLNAVNREEAKIKQTASPLTPSVRSEATARQAAPSSVKGEGLGIAVYSTASSGTSARVPETTKQARVSIIIPTFNHLPLTQQCLEAIRRHTPVAHEIVIVDNASTDGTVEYLRQAQATGQLRLICNSENSGFSHACNQGARVAQSDLVLFLNNDTVPQPGWLEPLIDLIAADPSIGAVGSKLLYPDGTIQHAGIIICDDQKAQDPLLARLVYRGEPADLKDANVVRQFQALTAACLLVRKSAFTLVEGFDERYWNGYEDVDLCFKLRNRNWKLLYQPASVVIHHESQSGPERFAKAQENILRLHQKWLGKIQPDLIVKQSGEVVVTAESLGPERLPGVSRAGVPPAVRASRPGLLSTTSTLAGETPAAAAGTAALLEKRGISKVSIVVLTLNNLPLTRQCLESIERHTARERYELIVVDNGSSDGTIDYLQQLQKQHEHIRVIANKTNRGFAAGNNQGISIARGDAILLLNNDTVVTAGWLERLSGVLEQYPDAGLAGPISNCVSGPQQISEAGYDDLKELPAFARHWANAMAGQSLEVTRLVGFCLLARREVIERIGGLDEQFGSGNFEDDDLCLRALSVGFKARIAQDAFVHHAGSQTFKTQKIDARAAMLVNWRLFKSKWNIPAEAPIEKGYRLPLRMAATYPLKVALPNVEADHQSDSEKRWWQQTEPTPSPLTTSMKLPFVAEIGSLRLATELLRRKEYGEAWDKVIEAMALRPFHPEGWLLLAEIARSAGDFPQARHCAERACQLAPNWKQARKFLKSLPGGKKESEFSWTRLPSSSSPPRLSVCLIVRNEEKFLGPCLKSVREIAQQIVVVDTGSSDRTPEIAREYGAEVYSFAWTDDFSAARNAALEHATGDWILILDADEDLPPESREALKKEIQSHQVLACRLPIFDAGKEDEGCSYVPRLFRNAPGLFFVGRVHEQIFPSIEIHRREWGLENRLGKAALRHHGYTSEVIRDRNKNERNLALLRKAIEETPNEPNLLMNYGLELVRSGNLAGGLEHYWSAFRALAALPEAQVIPELRETLLTQLSTQLLKQKDFHAVVDLLNSPLAKTGLTASLHFTGGLALMELKQFSEAIAQMRECLAKRNRPALSPVNKDIHKGGPHHCLALCLKMIGQSEAATKAFAQAVTEDPGSSTLRLAFARFLAETGKTLESLQTLHQIISDKPDEMDAWLLGGEIALTQPEFLEFARDWTGEAIKYFPEKQSILLQRAEALLLSGDAEQALPFWRRGGFKNERSAAVPSRSASEIETRSQIFGAASVPPAAADDSRAATEIGVHDRSNPRQLAAWFLCELLCDGEPEIPPDLEPAVSREFLKWYRALLQAGAAGLIGSVHSRLDRLRLGLPLACQLLEQALVEAESEAAAETICK